MDIDIVVVVVNTMTAWNSGVFEQKYNWLIFLVLKSASVVLSFRNWGRAHWCHKKNTNASRRQEFFRRWTVYLELSACRITWQRYLTCTVY